MDDRLADEAAQAVEFQLPLESRRPRARRVVAEVIPDGAGNDVVTREDVQNVDEDVAHDADLVDRVRDRAAHAVEIAEIVAADADVQHVFPVCVEDRLELSEDGGAALDVGDGRTFEDGHEAALLRRTVIDRSHQLHVGFYIAEIHLGQDVACQNVARRTHEVEKMLHVIGGAHAHEEQRRLALLFCIDLLERREIRAQDSLGIGDRHIADRVLQTEADGRQMLIFLPTNLLHDVLLVGGHVEKPAHLVLQDFPIFHSW